MGQPGRGLRLALEPAQCVVRDGRVQAGLVDQLDGEQAVQDRIPGLEHDRHAASADHAAHLVPADLLRSFHAARVRQPAPGVGQP